MYHSNVNVDLMLETLTQTKKEINVDMRVKI